MSPTIEFTRTNSNGVETVHTLPAKFAVCGGCKGYGTILNPNIGEYAYTAEEFAESFDDYEREQYFKRGGIYDIPCPFCKGIRVVLIVDEVEANKTLKGRRTLVLYNAKLADDAAYQREIEAERKFGY